MIDTGIIRKMDDLGRITIPKELRDNLDIKYQDALEISLNGKIIMLQKHETYCAICGGEDDVQKLNGIPLCGGCHNKLAS